MIMLLRNTINLFFSIQYRLRQYILKLILLSLMDPETHHIKSSVLSTVHNTLRHSNRTGNSRPKTANLIYAKKPYSKDTPKWNQSVSTWRFSSRTQTFSKDKRFRVQQPYSLDILEPDIQTEKSKKSTSFGKGRRTPIPEYILRNAKQKPSPNSYTISNLDELTRSPSKGKSFQSNWERYEKLFIDHRQDVYSRHFVKNNPPAKYDVRQTPGKDKNSFTLYGRQKMYTDRMANLMRDVPGPHYSVKDRHIYSTIGYQNCSFTEGSRMDLSAPANYNPSGSQYFIPGFCDKYKTTKKKNCPE